jgi:hypothetical protein
MSSNGGDCLRTDEKIKKNLHLYEERIQECQFYF